MLMVLDSMRPWASSGELAEVKVSQVGHIGSPTLS